MAEAQSEVPEPSGGALTFSDLPDEVLALVASLGLTEARDVASFAATCKRCAAVVAGAPLRLGVRPSLGAAASPQEEQAAARASLQALCASWPGTAELDLRGCPLEDRDILAALRALPSLAALHLSGCKKLTASGCTAVLGVGHEGGGCGAVVKGLPPRSPLRTITLQRCFQLNAAALTDVLAAAAAPGSRLACAALSHLSLAGWPEARPTSSSLPAAAGATGDASALLPAGQLRMLALHNCAKLGSTTLAALVAACPRLEVLMLGGCSFALEEGPAASAGASGGPSHSASDGCQAACPPQLGALEAQAAKLHETALGAALEVMPTGMPTMGGGYATHVASLAAILAAAAVRLPHLRVLELTFAPPGLVPTLQHLVATEPLLLAGRPEPLQVWDLCTSPSVAQALEWQLSVAVRHAAAAPAGSIASAGATARLIAPGDAAAFLYAAVNCSSGGRATPLHAAAEEGDPALLRALLGLGAAVDARTRSGATPLFLACEGGRARSVECLLAAGAKIDISNSADEAPLYICALKGHERCVELLLEHCRQRGISWQRLRSDDGWTPLMAAAVGPGRASIVLKLLQAAGQEAPELVQAANRYGQTALHVAARKAGPSLLRSLVDAGGAASLLAADADGRLPLDIAKRNNNGSALRVLADAGGALAAMRREQARQRSTMPTAERPRTNDHRQQHPPQRWVGRRLQQRKGAGGNGPQGSASSSSGASH